MIINPWFFYAIQVCDNVGGALTIIGILALFAAAAVGFMIITDSFWDEDEKRARKFAKKAVIIGVISCIIAVFIPTKETLIEMQIANLATKENIDSAVTYVIDAVKDFEAEDK